MAKRSKKHTFSKFVFPYYVRVSCCCCVCVCLGNCCRLIFDSTSFRQNTKINHDTPLHNLICKALTDHYEMLNTVIHTHGSTCDRWSESHCLPFLIFEGLGLPVVNFLILWRKFGNHLFVHVRAPWGSKRRLLASLKRGTTLWRFASSGMSNPFLSQSGTTMHIKI